MHLSGFYKETSALSFLITTYLYINFIEVLYLILEDNIIEKLYKKYSEFLNPLLIHVSPKA